MSIKNLNQLMQDTGADRFCIVSDIRTGGNWRISTGNTERFEDWTPETALEHGDRLMMPSGLHPGAWVSHWFNEGKTKTSKIVL